MYVFKYCISFHFVTFAWLMIFSIYMQNNLSLGLVKCYSSDLVKGCPFFCEFIIPTYHERSATIYCSLPFPNPAHALSGGCDWLNLSAVPSSLGAPIHLSTWALDSASYQQQGKFLHFAACLQRHGHQSGILLLLLTCQLFPAILKNPPHSNWTLLSISPVNFFFVQREGDTSEELCVSTKRLVGLCSFFGSVEFLCWSEKAWERNCPRQLERLKPRLKSPERLQLHPPRPMDR